MKKISKKLMFLLSSLFAYFMALPAMVYADIILEPNTLPSDSPNMPSPAPLPSDGPNVPSPVPLPSDNSNTALIVVVVLVLCAVVASIIILRRIKKNS